MWKLNLPALAVVGAFSTPSLALATTYVVDSGGGPGSNFLDLPPAIAFAAPGDVLLVRPGSYSGFTLDKPLAIIAQDGNVNVLGNVVVHNLAAGAVASLVALDLQASSLGISNCAGTVIGDSLIVPYSSSISGSADVRLRSISGSGTTFVAMLQVSASRVELVESTLRGSDAIDQICSFNPPDDGGTAVDVTSGEIHVARCNLAGGSGGDGFCADPGLCQNGGNGGDGLRLGTNARGLVTGVAAQVLAGGLGGQSCPFMEGIDGVGLELRTGAQARYSGATIAGIYNSGGTLQHAVPADPSMHVLEVPRPGGELTFRVNAPVGSRVTLGMGLRPIVHPIAGLQEDILVQTVESYDLGTVPSQGSVSYLFHIPASWSKGTTRVFQAVATMPSTSARGWSHSIPIVVR